MDCYRMATWCDLPCAQCGVMFRKRRIHIAHCANNFCSPSCAQIGNRKHQVIEFDGDIFYLGAGGYFQSVRTNRRLHRVIWEQEHGEIPAGYVIHHKNGCKIDNRIENLQLMEWGEHTRHEHLGISHQATKKRPVCSCGKLAVGRGMCSKHYQAEASRLKKAGLWKPLL